MMKKNLKKTIAAIAAAMAITTAFTSTATVFANDGKNLYNFSVQDTSILGYVSSKGANVRENPTTASPVINTLAPGAQIEITGYVTENGSANGWYVIETTDQRYGGFCSGYIAECTFTKAGSGHSKSSNQAVSDGAKFVHVDTGYLALRTAPAYDEANEIGELYNGDSVEITGGRSGNYVWVYSPKYGCSGYVNSNFLY